MAKGKPLSAAHRKAISRGLAQFHATGESSAARSKTKTARAKAMAAILRGKKKFFRKGNTSALSELPPRKPFRSK